jgi:hypothetical protein
MKDLLVNQSVRRSVEVGRLMNEMQPDGEISPHFSTFVRQAEFSGDASLADNLPALIAALKFLFAMVASYL